MQHKGQRDQKGAAAFAGLVGHYDGESGPGGPTMLPVRRRPSAPLKMEQGGLGQGTGSGGENGSQETGDKVFFDEHGKVTRG